MRVIRQLADLPAAPAQAVIINCGTRWVTSLALVSTLRNAAVPLLLIDCESEDGSEPHFRALARRYQLAFHWLSWPLRDHGTTLDALFRDMRCERLLLVDSDVEIRSSAVYAQMHALLAADAAGYGAGFLHRSGWMGREHGVVRNDGYYAERMWIPLVLLKTDVVREALSRGSTFRARRRFLRANRTSMRSSLKAFMLRLVVYGGLGTSDRSVDGASRLPRFEGPEPLFIEYDTGAELHAALLASGRRFCALPDGLWGEVEHFHGITRASRLGVARRLVTGLRFAGANATREIEIIARVRTRLRSTYGVELDDSR